MRAEDLRFLESNSPPTVKIPTVVPTPPSTIFPTVQSNKATTALHPLKSVTCR